jgi:hypothetical protein
MSQRHELAAQRHELIASAHGQIVPQNPQVAQRWHEDMHTQWPAPSQLELSYGV